jgi:hypothetical protein
MIKKWVVIILVVLVGLLGCVRPDGAVIVLGEKIEVTEEDIKEKQLYLSQLNSVEDIKDNVEGTAVFEGIVLKKKIVENNIYEVDIKINWILYGITTGKTYIKVNTPAMGMYGVDFEIGKHYRILAFGEGGLYRTWNWSGTHKLSQPK